MTRRFQVENVKEVATALLLSEDLNSMSCDRVAERLCMSQSTYRRYLRQEGETHLKVLNRVRSMKLQRIVTFSRPMYPPGKQLAEPLGFNEKNSFYRWFKSQFGMDWTEGRHIIFREDSEVRKDEKFRCLKCGRECDVIEIDESDYEEMWGASVKHEMYRDVSRCCGSEDLEAIEEGKDDD